MHVSYGYKREQILADRIKDYWLKRGSTIKVWIEGDKPDGHHGTLYSLRSNLIGGLPPKGAA